MTPLHHIVPEGASRSRIAMTHAELVAWGERLGTAASPPLIIAVSGELGAGKTTLAQAICRGYGVTDDVTSPTFALVHEYHAERSQVFHLDLYRLAGPADLTNLGWDDIISANALVLVEWPDRAAHRLPRNHVPIEIEHLAGDATRRVLLAG